MKKQRIAGWVVIVLTMGSFQAANAVLLGYDGFVAGTDNAAGEYIANPGTDTSGRHKLIVGQNPAISGFTGEWIASGGAQYEIGSTPLSSLSYSDGTDSVATSGNAVFRKYTLGSSTRALDNSVLGLDVDGNTRYFSFLMELGDASAVGRIEFGEAEGRVWGTGFRIQTDGTSFIATGNSSITSLGATDTDTHLFVWKLTTGAGATDNWELFMDPVLSSEGANTAVASMTGGGSSIDLTHLTLYREAGGTAGNGIMFDEIRIGETWADVTTVEAPPVSFSDTFESYPTGTELPAPWVVTSTDSSNSTVNILADQSPFGSGTNAVNYYDDSTNLNPKIEYDLSMATTNPLSIQFDFKLNSALGIATFQIEGSDGQPAMYLNLVANTTELRNQTGSTTYDLILDTAEDTWYHVDILTSAINPSGNETYDISVTPFGGTATTVNDLVFRTGVATAFTRVQFMQNAGATAKSDIVLDNFSVAEVVGIVSPYEQWTQSYNLIGTNADYTANPDGDRLNNLYEWGLGGDPTDEFDQGISPTYGTALDGGTNWFVYVYPTNSVATDLVYYLETDTDLVFAPGWTNANYEVVGASDSVDGF
ncbi:MAG: hypothetical protein U9P12_00610, partial [Verrucomicrobiota bacterium]|nr:hypothetical protein [Verrucomicrobiota bacterium]